MAQPDRLAAIDRHGAVEQGAGAVIIDPGQAYGQFCHAPSVIDAQRRALVVRRSPIPAGARLDNVAIIKAEQLGVTGLSGRPMPVRAESATISSLGPQFS